MSNAAWTRWQPPAARCTAFCKDILGLRGEGTPFGWRAKGVPSPLKLPPSSPKRALFRRMGGAGAREFFLRQSSPGSAAKKPFLPC